MTTSSTEDLIRARMQEHRDAVAAIKEKTAPQRVERDALLARRAELDAEIAVLNQSIIETEWPISAEKRGIAACALALGSKRLGGGFTE